MHRHHHQLTRSPLSFDSKVKGFSLYVESEDASAAIAALENARSQLKSGGEAFKESEVTIGCVRVRYEYPYRPHCASKGLYWDEES